MNKLATYVGIALLALGGSMTAQAADTIPATHLHGSVDIPKNPKRVVVLDFSVLDNMMSLGAEAEMALPKKLMPDYLAQYRDEKYLDLGSMKEFNLETVNAFKPELIIISTRQSDHYEELSKIAPVYVVDRMAKDQMAEAKKNIDVMGKIFGKEAEAAKALADLDASLAAATETASKSGKKALFIMVNDGKISVFGSKSRFASLPFDSMGVGQSDPSIQPDKYGQLVNYEYIAVKNPDIIYILDRSKAIGEESDSSKLLTNPLVKNTKAVKNGKVVMLDPALWYITGSGIESMKTMIKQISEGLK